MCQRETEILEFKLNLTLNLKPNLNPEPFNLVRVEFCDNARQRDLSPK